MPEIPRCLLKEGDNAAAQKLVLQNFTCKGPGSGQGSGANVPYGCYEVLGNLRLTFQDEGADSPRTDRVRRLLDLNEAVAQVRYERNGVRFEREVLAARRTR